IFLLLFLVLYFLSYAIIDRFRRKDWEDYFSTDEDEVTVYKISLYLCVFSLSVAICAALLLPISIISNEILHLYPKSYYVKWLNHSLIQGIWNLVFLFSNVSLFAFLPFAYLFTESEGFIGYRKGVKSRVIETVTVFSLLAAVVLGLTCVISAMIGNNASRYQSLNDLGNYYLPFLYSCMSFLGVLMLLICTPLGFIRLFGVVSRSLVKPQFLQNINEEYSLALMEEEVLQRRLKNTMLSGECYIRPKPMTPVYTNTEDADLLTLQNGALLTNLTEKLAQVTQRRKQLQDQKDTSSFQRNVVYPTAMLLLLAVTVITVFLVLLNTLQLLIGIKALPSSTTDFTLGLTSLSKLGTVGAAFEVVVIIYLAVTSCVGLYTMPGMSSLRPKVYKTSLPSLIANSAVLLILSSAIPLLSRTLGITNFDLLGDFAKIEWLGNFQVVMLYNFFFAGVSTLCLVKKLTAPVCKELITR
ncbi:hypothetical protein AAG570_010698, partial [Ranatra chinensis]